MDIQIDRNIKVMRNFKISFMIINFILMIKIFKIYQSKILKFYLKLLNKVVDFNFIKHKVKDY